MDLIIACAYWLLLVLALQVLVAKTCMRHPALRRWRSYLAILAVVWCLAAVVKKCYIDDILPPADATEHELNAREFAGLFRDGRFGEAVSCFAVGNSAYQLCLGLCYAVTGAPEVIIYTLNGAFAFWGLLGLLDILGRHTQCVRLPASVLTAIMLLPSAVVWTTTNLKEGLVLWGICMMLYLTVPSNGRVARSNRIRALSGLLCTTVLRPHIAAAWLLAIAAGALLGGKRIGLFTVAIAGVLTSMVLLSSLAPQLVQAALDDGVRTTLSSRYDALSLDDRLGGSHLTGRKPLPVLSGLLLILFRPWPSEVDQLTGLFAGLEMWVLAAFGLLNWKDARARMKLLIHPAIVTHLTALLVLGFFFSYMHNMGLVVRQRVMCFPAVISLYAWPLIAQQGLRIARARQPLSRRFAPASAAPVS